MPIDTEKLKERADLCAALKEKLIENLDLPFKPEDIHEDTLLIGSGLGVDSLDILEIILCVEGNFSVKIPNGDFAPLRSINTLADFISAERNSK